MGVNRLTCDINGSRLTIIIGGELCSGDLINFSYRALQYVDKMAINFIVLVDVEEAKFNLIDGLWQKICSQFNEKAVKRNVLKIAYILPPYLYMKCRDCAAPSCVRIFERDKAAAEAWLNESSPVTASL